MDSNYHSHTDVDVQIAKVGEDVVECHDQSISSSVQIMFEFCLQRKFRLTYLEDTEQDAREVQLQQIIDYAYVDHDQFLHYRRTCEIIHDALEAWPICNCRRESLIKKIFSTTRAMAKSISPGHYVLCIAVDVKLIYHHDVDESRMLNVILQQSIEENNEYNMVPASDSSIKSLKRKILDDNDSHCCTICLDKISKRYKPTVVQFLNCSVDWYLELVFSVLISGVKTLDPNRFPPK
ncbi:E3 ubiquitin-protein ligase [Forsythia ovata]|uniref:E3 ubiquitin-protein ligase n=1 Tax=Forsythia ovata TaxID=205694 RepID=A0ABD1T5C4_9LAMI